jgi:hypothetical protein
LPQEVNTNGTAIRNTTMANEKYLFIFIIF